MNVTVTGRHLDITDAIRGFAADKAARLERYYDRVSAVEVVVGGREKHGHDVEMIVHVDNHDPFVARAREEDLYAAIDVVVDKLGRQLTDHKERLRNRKHPAA